MGPRLREDDVGEVFELPSVVMVCAVAVDAICKYYGVPALSHSLNLSCTEMPPCSRFL